MLWAKFSASSGDETAPRSPDHARDTAPRVTVKLEGCKLRIPLCCRGADSPLPPQ